MLTPSRLLIATKEGWNVVETSAAAGPIRSLPLCLRSDAQTAQATPRIRYASAVGNAYLSRTAHALPRL
jgi:hypothetical protein